MRFSFVFPLVLVFLVFISVGFVQAELFESQDVILVTPTGDIFGTLLAPVNAGEVVPVVLIIAGSGPTDRDGNTSFYPGKNNSLKQIAEGLAGFGVASLRYDKRGIGASEAAAVSEKQLRFGHSISDARQWCDMLASDTRFSAVIVAGHSQGSLVGMNAAWEAGVDGFASISGAGNRLCDVLRFQLKDQFSIRSRVEVEKVLVAMENGRLVPEPPTELSILFRPSIQPFLISWQQYSPTRDIARLQMPVLILQGTTDTQTSEEDAHLLAKSSPGSSLVMLEGYNHILKHVISTNPVDHQRSFADSTLTISPEAVAALVLLAKDAEAAKAANKSLLANVDTFNLGLSSSDNSDGFDKLLASRTNKSVAENVGFWARYFEGQNNVLYCFGPNDGGYVSQGMLVSDQRHDCVSLMYRCSELARSANSVESVRWALKSRFAGASLASFVGASGNVDYDHPAHLDYSLDMIRTGIWGVDITPSMAGVMQDEVGTSRYPAGSFSYVASDSLVLSELHEGDVVWLVFNPENKKAAKFRNEYGLVIGHIGLVIMQDDEPWLVHAATSELPGYYQGGTVVKVPLAVYLQRVEKFSGLMVTRFME